MESESPILLIIPCILSLACIAFLASAETAFASLLDVRDFARRKTTPRRSQRVERLMAKSRALFLALKGGVAVAYFVLVASTTLLAQALAAQWPIGFELLLLILAVMVGMFYFAIQELLASRFVLRRSVRVAENLSFPLAIYFHLTKPLVYPTLWLLDRISRMLNIQPEGQEHQAILALVDNGEENHLEDDERAMIHSIIEFGDTEVHEIMVPRTDMVCVEENATIKQVQALVKEKGHSRLPLYREDVDHILGILHVKDLLTANAGQSGRHPKLKSLARPAYFVPETKKLDALLKEFQAEKHHMAIVVDEYGGTAGLITLEDVLEEIVGDIQDEHDKEPPLVRQLNDTTYMIDAKIDLHELNEKLALDLPTEGEYESLAGFILTLTGYVPEQGEVVHYQQFSFTVEEVDRNRIMKVKLKISKVPSQESSVESQ